MMTKIPNQSQVNCSQDSDLIGFAKRLFLKVLKRIAEIALGGWARRGLSGGT
jgi:hypothetical protein